MTKEITVSAKPEKVRHLSIHSITYDPQQNISVKYRIGDIDVDGKFAFDYTEQAKVAIIAGDAFTELNADKPIWAPNKPKDTYRESDIWHVINEIDEGRIKTEPEAEKPIKAKPLG